MPDGLTPLFLDNEFSTPDVNKFRSLVASAVTVSTLDAATRGDRSASPRSRQIMLPAGLGDELRAVFRTGTATWGYACLHRAPGPSFDDDEISFVRAVAPQLQRGWRQDRGVKPGSFGPYRLRPGRRVSGYGGAYRSGRRLAGTCGR
jgi:hypothetical protein